MKRGWSLIAALLAIAIIFGTVAAPAFAGEQKPPTGDCGEFYLLAVHGINGKRLGLDKELPVDVYVNGGYAFTFEFKDRVGPVKLEAGKYTIDVYLKGQDPNKVDPVMSLGPAELPGCSKVRVVAKLVDGVPTLLAKVRPLPHMK